MRDLDTLLQKRILSEIFPAIAGGFLASPPGVFRRTFHLPSVYDATVSFLYKVLCLLFADSRNLLEPASQQQLQHILTHVIEDPPSLDSTTIYSTLLHLFARFPLSISHYVQHNSALSLFEISPSTREFFTRYSLSNAIIARALKALTHVEETPIDYSAIAVSLLGSIYEKLLDYRLILKDGDRATVYLVPDKKKRKATGSYYTPDYIVQYIVSQTLTPIIERRAAQFQALIRQWAQIDTTTAELQQQRDRLQQQAWNILLDIKVCDPAMGSGVFLLAAVDFIGDRLMEMLQQHPEDNPILHHLDRLQPEIFYPRKPAKISPVASARHRTQRLKQAIVQHCIYGVDLNPMAVDLTKVSLWLHFCTLATPLQGLNSHLRCANSLLGILPNEPSKHPDFQSIQQARKVCQDVEWFNWFSEFPDIFNRCHSPGFDAAISNPPYQRPPKHHPRNSPLANYYKIRFTAATGKYDLSVLFLELAAQLISPTGRIGMILPHHFTTADFGKGIRHYISHHPLSYHLCSLGSNQVFADATTYTCLIFLQHSLQPILYYYEIPDVNSDVRQIAAALNQIKNEDFAMIFKPSQNAEAWVFTQVEEKDIFSKLDRCTIPLSELVEGIYQGVVTGLNDVFVLEAIAPENSPATSEAIAVFSPQLQQTIQIEQDILKPFVKGEDIHRFGSIHPRRFILYPYQTIGDRIALYSEAQLQEQFPLAYHYLQQNQATLQQRGSDRMSYESWYALWNSRNPHRFAADKILVPDICHYGNMTLSFDAHLIHADTTYAIVPHPEIHLNLYALLALLNSKLLWFFLTKIGTPLRGNYFRYKTHYLQRFPIYQFAFNTPPDERDRYREKAIDTTEYCLGKSDDICIIGFVQHHLRYRRTDVIHDLLAHLAEQMLSLNQQLSANIGEFLTTLEAEIDTSIDTLSNKTQLRNYLGDYQKSESPLTEEELFAILEKNKGRLSVDIQARSHREKIQAAYHTSLTQTLPLKARLAATDKLIDKIIYRLYQLTEPEIERVEKS